MEIIHKIKFSSGKEIELTDEELKELKSNLPEEKSDRLWYVPYLPGWDYLPERWPQYTVTCKSADTITVNA